MAPYQAAVALMTWLSILVVLMLLMLGCGPHQAVVELYGLGILDYVSASIYAGLWPPSNSGSTDGFSIPASVDAVEDAVTWSPMWCGFEGAMMFKGAAIAIACQLHRATTHAMIDLRFHAELIQHTDAIL